MSTHNKGPWKYERETNTIRTEVENYWLASMNSFDGAVNNDANGDLIAAAPTMFACLEALLNDPNTSVALKSIIRPIVERAKGLVHSG